MSTLSHDEDSKVRRVLAVDSCDDTTGRQHRSRRASARAGRRRRLGVSGRHQSADRSGAERRARRREIPARAQRHPAAFVDARDFVVTDDQFTHANVNFKKTNPRGRRLFKRVTRAHGDRVVPVVTGFIGATEDGQTTTIGRNGSDYSAAIVGAALGASVIEIWTDVDGVLSADPRVVPAAFVLPQMTYEEAMELSYFGAKVLHSATIAPAVARRIPILIKNTFNPSAAGTLISGAKSDPGEALAKGITTVGQLSLLTLSGPG